MIAAFPGSRSVELLSRSCRVNSGRTVTALLLGRDESRNGRYGTEVVLTHLVLVDADTELLLQEEHQLHRLQGRQQAFVDETVIVRDLAFPHDVVPQPAPHLLRNNLQLYGHAPSVYL